ncbi:CDP-alcohol phosphatidyltransferase family protein [Myxococcota bacterium]|nr:CDP-alcohol phosphatidyltransferase family protein [Myxococcota bacterium]
MQGKRYRIQDIQRSFHSDKRWEEISGELPAWLIFRPLSFWLTVPFVNGGWSPLAVSLLSGVAALAMLGSAIWGGGNAYLWVAAFGFLHQLLDCVDGNVARVTGRTSQLGQFVDLLIGQIYWVLLFASIGILVEKTGSGAFADRAVVFALVLSILVLLNRVTRNYAQLHFEKRQIMDDRPEGEVGMGKAVVIALAGLENLYVFAIAIGGALDALSVVLMGIGVYVVAVFVYVETELFFELRHR